MQAESSKKLLPIEFFLPDDSEYDSDETLDLLGYDLVEISDEQNRIAEEMEEIDDIVSSLNIIHTDSTNSTITNLIGRICLIGESWKIFDFFSQKHITIKYIYYIIGCFYFG